MSKPPPPSLHPHAVRVGDWAVKKKGYPFEGTVRSVFLTGTGELRFVVDFQDTGMLHIFNADQLNFYLAQDELR